MTSTNLQCKVVGSALCLAGQKNDTFSCGLWEFDYGPESNVLVVDGRALFEPILVQGQISGTNNSFFSAATRP